MIKQFFLSVLFTALSLPLVLAQSPDSYAYSEDGCASGGPIYYFGNTGDVIVSVCGDDCPSVSTGTWSLSGSTITVRLKERYYGEGENFVMAAASNVYEDYTARSEKISETEYISWSGPNGDYTCESVYRHNKDCSDVHAFLKNDFRGDYNFVSTRVV